MTLRQWRRNKVWKYPYPKHSPKTLNMIAWRVEICPTGKKPQGIWTGWKEKHETSEEITTLFFSHTQSDSRQEMALILKCSQIRRKRPKQWNWLGTKSTVVDDGLGWFCKLFSSAFPSSFGSTYRKHSSFCGRVKSSFGIVRTGLVHGRAIFNGQRVRNEIP